jgi:hypothetical protein
MTYWSTGQVKSRFSTLTTEYLSFLLRRAPVGGAAECDSLEGSPCGRTAGIASSRGPGLPGKADHKFQGQDSRVVPCNSILHRFSV